MTTSTHDHYVAAQQRTLATADKWGQPWTCADVDYIMAHTDSMTDEQLATGLGRTLAAIWNMQHRIISEGAAGVAATLRAGRTRAVATPARVERTYTFVGDDVPPGWND